MAMMVTLPRNSFSASCTICSVWLSMREVASSSSRMRGWPASARAIAISCFWPDDSREPPSPSGVS